MSETTKLFFLNKSAVQGRGQSYVGVENVQQMLIDQSASRWGRYERKANGLVFVNSLPVIERVHTWEQSATRRWSLFDLTELKTKSPSRLAAWIAPESRYAMPDLEAEGVVELIMHRELIKASNFMKEVIKRRSQARKSFQQTLGSHISRLILQVSDA